jgi:hypothetical protein
MSKESICALALMLAFTSRAVSAQAVQKPQDGAIQEKRVLEVRVIERASRGCAVSGEFYCKTGTAQVNFPGFS